MLAAIPIVYFSLKFDSRMYKVHQASKIFNLKNCLGW